MRVHQSWVRVLLVTVTFTLLAACSSQQQQVSFEDPKGIQPTITIDNTAPSNIDLNFHVSVSQSDPDQPIHFRLFPSVTYHSLVVNFIHGEKFVCGGKVIPNGEIADITPIPPAGTTATCTYESPQGRASFSYTVPAQPTIVSPASGATVTRSAQTPITVTMLPNCKDLGTIVGERRPDKQWDIAGAEGAGCVAHQTVNSLPYAAGPGMLGVQEELQTSLVTNNPGFHSFTLSITGGAIIPVTWK